MNSKEKILILGINGSPRKKGNTIKLLRSVLNSAEKAGATTEIIHLIDKQIKPCLGCYSTKAELCAYPCKQKDDMQKLYKTMITANGFVLASPVYWGTVSALMKKFLERLTCLENVRILGETPLLDGKVAAFVSTGAEECGDSNVVEQMLYPFNTAGCVIVPYRSAYGVYHPELKKKELLGKSYWHEGAERLGKNLVLMCKLLKEKKINWWQSKNSLPSGN